ncbi:DNA translocase FtsK [Schnuerera sp. xch1]|uniref:DNA translocase FtsK n=1 Tax=Schnuerera sp. xch1 TaxID=2874283 RepID=UPI001CBC2F03|nr:DNA translocase FtsK [Schnuerera sp. xch1]
MVKKKKTKKTKNTKKKEYNREIIGIIIILFGILSAISLFSKKTGIMGVFLRNIYFTLMGFGGYIFPLIIIAIGILFIINRVDTKNDFKSVYLLVLFLCFLTLLDINNVSGSKFGVKLSESLQLSKQGLGGGILGAILGYLLFKLFGSIGSYVIISFIILISIVLFTEVKISEIWNQLNLKFKAKKINNFNITDKINKNKKNKRDIKETIKNVSSLNNIQNDKEQEILIHDYTKIQKEPHNKTSTDNEISINNKNVIPNYTLPSLDLLDDFEKNPNSNDRKGIINNAKKIEETMKNFGIDSKITQINKGPSITCYEIQPAPGVKVSKIVNLSNDLALSLAASDIRIVAPIPGKAAVGIEVPNKIKDNVGLKEILQSDEYLSLNSQLPLTLGKDISGKAIVSNIDKMPHLLIAGATGSGKSVCINTIIMSILFKSHPSDVKLLLIDPKVVELSIYNGIPHLLIPVVTETKKAASALSWAVDEMEKRYKLFAENNVRDIKSYNHKLNNDKNNKLPKIVIIIDELADLMMVAAQEIEDYICRLAQMARAAGIYLIIATQRPSVDVITGIIKANIPSRISFAVSSQVDSRTILDMPGAEKLLGKGDMLFYPSNLSKPIRIQGAFISDTEVKKVVDYLKEQNITEYNDEVIETIQNEIDINNFIEDGDKLLPDAISLVVSEGQASISLLQRKLKVGYARAARIVDQMEERGIVGGHEGSKPRKVLVSKEEVESIIKERL